MQVGKKIEVLEGKERIVDYGYVPARYLMIEVVKGVPLTKEK